MKIYLNLVTPAYDARNSALSHSLEAIKYLGRAECMLQVTLSGEIIQEEKFHVIGFVPADVVRLKKAVWFRKLDAEQVRLVDQFLAESSRF